MRKSAKDSVIYGFRQYWGDYFIAAISIFATIITGEYLDLGFGEWDLLLILTLLIIGSNTLFFVYKTIDNCKFRKKEHLKAELNIDTQLTKLTEEKNVFFRLRVQNIIENLENVRATVVINYGNKQAIHNCRWAYSQFPKYFDEVSKLNELEFWEKNGFQIIDLFVKKPGSDHLSFFNNESIVNYGSSTTIEIDLDSMFLRIDVFNDFFKDTFYMYVNCKNFPLMEPVFINDEEYLKLKLS